MTVKRKIYGIQVKEKRENGGQIVISTGVVDRDKDRVLPQGARVDDYLKNPVVQYAHNYYEPWATVGRTNSMEITDEGIVVDFDLRPAANEHDPQNIVLLLWNGDWIRTASIGFNPDQWEDNDVGGIDWQGWELLEWSLVPVPANQEALRLGKSLGDTAELLEALGRMAAESFRVESERFAASLKGMGVVPQMRALMKADPDLSREDAFFKAVVGEAESILEEKHGRVLSAANEGRLTRARDLLDEVLEQVQADEEEDDKGKDAPAAYASELIEMLREVMARSPGLSPVAALNSLFPWPFCSDEDEAKSVSSKTAVPYSAHGETPLAPEDTPWDGDAARQRLQEWAGGEEWDPDQYAQGFAFVDGDPANLGSYQGPHHDVVEGAFSVVWNGVRRAMASLVLDAQGGRIEEDDERREVYEHLAAHYAEFEKETPEFRAYEESELREMFPEHFAGDDEHDNDDEAEVPPGDDDEKGAEALAAAMGSFVAAIGEELGVETP